MQNILALLSGADGRQLKHAEAGRTVWVSVGLNIFLAALLAGAAAALSIDTLLPHAPYLPWLWTGVLTLCLTLVGLRLVIKYAISSLRRPHVVVVLILCLIVAALTISLPFEAKLLLVANPGGHLVKAGTLQDQLLEWLQATNGLQTLMLLRLAIRLSSFIIFSLPFFVSWNARSGTYFQIKNAQQELQDILTTIK